MHWENKRQDRNKEEGIPYESKAFASTDLEELNVLGLQLKAHPHLLLKHYEVS